MHQWWSLELLESLSLAHPYYEWVWTLVGICLLSWGFEGCLNKFEALWGVLSGPLGIIWVLIGLRQYEDNVLSACSLSVDVILKSQVSIL